MTQQPSTRVRWIRVAALVVLTGAAYVGLRATGLSEQIGVGSVRDAVLDAGVWGVALFSVVFALGELVHIPGMVFVAGGILAYGKLTGFAVSWLAAVFSVCVSFVLVRSLGGRLLAEIERPFVTRLLARLDERPITTVLLLRTVLWLAPPLNYALALSNVRFRHYLIGSAAGLVAPVGGAAVFFDWLFA